MPSTHESVYAPPESCRWDEPGCARLLDAQRSESGLLFQSVSLCALGNIAMAVVSIVQSTNDAASDPRVDEPRVVFERLQSRSDMASDIRDILSLYLHMLLLDEFGASPSERFCAKALLTGTQIRAAQALLALDQGDIKRGIKLIPRGSPYTDAIYQIVNTRGTNSDVWSFVRCEESIPLTAQVAACLKVDFKGALRLYRSESVDNQMRDIYTTITHHCVQYPATDGITFTEMAHTAQEKLWLHDLLKQTSNKCSSSEQATLYMLYFLVLIRGCTQSPEDWIAVMSLNNDMTTKGYGREQARKTLIAQYQMSIPTHIQQRAKTDINQYVRGTTEDYGRFSHVNRISSQVVTYSGDKSGTSMTTDKSFANINQTTIGSVPHRLQSMRSVDTVVLSPFRQSLVGGTDDSSKLDQYSDATMDLNELADIDRESNSTVGRVQREPSEPSTTTHTSPFANAAMADVPFSQPLTPLSDSKQRQGRNSAQESRTSGRGRISGQGNHRNLASVSLGESSPFSIRAPPTHLADWDKTEFVPAPVFSPRSKTSIRATIERHNVSPLSNSHQVSIVDVDEEMLSSDAGMIDIKDSNETDSIRDAENPFGDFDHAQSAYSEAQTAKSRVQKRYREAAKEMATSRHLQAPKTNTSLSQSPLRNNRLLSVNLKSKEMSSSMDINPPGSSRASSFSIRLPPDAATNTLLTDTNIESRMRASTAAMRRLTSSATKRRTVMINESSSMVRSSPRKRQLRGVESDDTGTKTELSSETESNISPNITTPLKRQSTNTSSRVTKATSSPLGKFSMAVPSGGVLIGQSPLRKTTLFTSGTSTKSTKQLRGDESSATLRTFSDSAATNAMETRTNAPRTPTTSARQQQSYNRITRSVARSISREPPLARSTSGPSSLSSAHTPKRVLRSTAIRQTSTESGEAGNSKDKV